MIGQCHKCSAATFSFTENIPRAVATPQSELGWDISAPITPKHTLHHLFHPFWSIHHLPFIIIICSFMYSAINTPTPKVSTPPLRLVRLERKELMELSSAKMHHHLLYPLCDDSPGVINPCISIHIHPASLLDKAEHRFKSNLVISSISRGWKLWTPIFVHTICGRGGDRTTHKTLDLMWDCIKYQLKDESQTPTVCMCLTCLMHDF